MQDTYTEYLIQLINASPIMLQAIQEDEANFFTDEELYDPTDGGPRPSFAEANELPF